jgi:hypothetical protein
MATKSQSHQQDERPVFGSAKPGFHPDSYQLDARVKQPVFVEQGHPPVNQAIVNGRPMLVVSIGGFQLNQIMWPTKSQAAT